MALFAALIGIHLPAQPPTLETLSRNALATLDGVTTLRGLTRRVRVVRDEWGVPHIYAQTARDLFFAQGYVMAQDRLWQMEIWRRSAEGRLSEIAGPGAAGRDRMARLLKYRGPADDQELSAYHPEARALMSAYVAGVNAFIETHRDRLPVEFVLTGIVPEPWTIETLVLRQTAFGDATGELQLARSAAQLGVAEANRRRNPDPWDELTIPAGLDLARFGEIGDEVIAAARGGGRGATRPDVLPQYRSLLQATSDRAEEASSGEPGSNNWVVSGAMSATGKPVVANDPHRDVTLPSLRYIVHLHAPGWNVIGASEPPFIGVAVGHNERVAWGLTIVGTDQHDVYVEELNPANPLETKWNGGWAPIRVVREEIRIKGQAPQTIELKFTRHGPIFYEDATRHRAYVVKSALHERGTAPYLAGLRLSQTKNCGELLDEAAYWHAPSENLICGDVEGTIGWRASAWTPDRDGWTGRLPVPGTGNYEWKGSRRDLPRELNPRRGFIATANDNVQPKGYRPFMFKNGDTRFDRITRLHQMLKRGTKYTIEDHQRLQNDAYSLRAASDVPLFRGWDSRDAEVERARALLASWDAVYTRESVAAAIYETLRTAAGQGGLPRADSPDQRRAALEPLLRNALDALARSQDTVRSGWRWGRMHTRAFAHPFVPPFNLPTVERHGGAGTVAADGATYREILDVADWDRSVVTNVPGQSGQPGSRFYGNLLPLWADNVYFPLVFSQAAVDRHAAHTLTLEPKWPTAGGSSPVEPVRAGLRHVP